MHASVPVAEMPERIPTVCFCGRKHAPWWGRYVPAPSCTLLPQDEAFLRMMQFGREHARGV